jgi:hypothetical protein
MFKPRGGFAPLAFAAKTQPKKCMSLGQGWVEPKGLAVGGLGLVESLELAEHVPEVVVERGRGGLELDRLLGMRQCVGRSAALEEDLAQIGACQCVGRVELDGSLKMRECFAQSAGFAEQFAQVIVGQGEIGAERERVTELIGGLAGSSQPLERQAEIGQGLGKIRLEAQGHPTRSTCTLKLPLGTIRLGQVGVELRTVRLEGHRPYHQLDRSGMIALLVVNHSQQVQDFGIVSLVIEHVLIQRGGLRELPRLVHLDGCPQNVSHGGHPCAKFTDLIHESHTSIQEPDP